MKQEEPINKEEAINYGEDYRFIPASSIENGEITEVAPDVLSLTVQIVNLCFIGDQRTNDFIIVDAGMPQSAEHIIQVAEARFGQSARPKAILLTHGHFDHVGAIVDLIKHWDVQVYAHPLECPYLSGEKSYPEPDPSVDGGLVAKVSRLFPNKPVNLGAYLRPLPDDHTLPELPDWQWVHTPGHTPGHVSYFRQNDGVLIAGDAFVTVKQESLYHVLTQDKTISGPPKYFTTDWPAAWDSVTKLQALNPKTAITGHGLPMSGQELTENLSKLVKKFDRIAIPQHGRYVNHDEH
ncbi:MBL fold metallo-hydrolase [Caldalkalibacillus salinus]|uniref:MBL fold metallo-hydrolase n=1 Tax=Caldalkalibacillus salinus TaxID=2803787 RepID=UPI001920744F|nr:MBL fold metallo-hydrolase [Caldalkalibacillus salinus]